MCLIKNEEKKTNYCLPCLILTNNGYIMKNRYYSNEFVLMKAFRQLNRLKTRIIPLHPLIFGESVNLC